MFGAIDEAFRQGMAVTSHFAPGKALGFHQAIYSAIHLRKPEEARKRMAEHLTHAQTVLMQTCPQGQVSERAE